MTKHQKRFTKNMIYNIEEIKIHYNQLVGRRDSISDFISVAENNLKIKTRELKNIEQAQLIIQEVAQKTQEELEYKLSELVTLALESIFDEPYEFKINFVIKRGRTEAEINFIKDGKIFDPMTESGGGAVDVASFALRVSLWNISKDKVCNTILLDEPFKFLSEDLQPRAGDMLKLLSDKLGIQFIIVTHNEHIIESADKIFRVTKRKGVSKITEVI